MERGGGRREKEGGTDFVGQLRHGLATAIKASGASHRLAPKRSNCSWSFQLVRPTWQSFFRTKKLPTFEQMVDVGLQSRKKRAGSSTWVWTRCGVTTLGGTETSQERSNVNNSCVVRATASYVLVPSHSPHHHLLQALCYLCCPTTEG